MNLSKPYHVRVLLALTTVQILFGINYVASKLIVGVMPPLVWANIRIVISGLSLFTIASLSKRKRPHINGQYLLPLALYALLGIVVNQGAFLVGLRYTSSTNSAILNTLIPIFTLLFVTLTGHEKFTLKRSTGFLFALAGVLVIRKVENLSLSDQTLVGDLLTVLNCISCALFLTLSKSFFGKHDPVWATAWLFCLGSVGITLIAIPQWRFFSWPQITPQLLGCMIFTTFGSTLLAYLLNLWALARARSSMVALFIYLQPVVASLLAWCWFGEIITLRTALSSVLIFSGMLLALF